MDTKNEEGEEFKMSFESYFNKEILPELDELEKERKKIKNKLTVPLFFVVTVALGLFAINPITGINAILIIIIGIVSLYGLYKRYKRRISHEFRGEFKNKVIRKVVLYIDKKYSYSAYGRIKKVDFESCGIFPFPADRYRGDDLVSGVYEEETEFSFSEIYAQRFVRDHKKRRHLVPLFKGLLFKADFNKNFKFTTVVLPDITEKYLGDIGQKIQQGNIIRTDLVKLENPEFEKQFSVYSDDQVEARYLLSPKLMERILLYKEKHDERISISFSGSSVYIAIQRIKDMFEPDYFKPLDQYDIIEKYYNDMQMTIDIVKELDLNTRIWSKQPKKKKEKRKNNHIGGIGYHGRGIFR